jgi:hypothetical protein
VVVAPNGDVFFSDSANDMVREVTTAGEVLQIAGTGIPGYYGDSGPAYNAELDDPTGLALDSSGDLFIADTGNNVVREVLDAVGDGADGTIETFAGNGQAGYAGDGGLATSAELDAPEGVAVDPNGEIAIADTGNSAVRLVSESRITIGRPRAVGILWEISTVAGDGFPSPETGDGGPATSAGLDYPTGVGYDAAGDLFVADTGNSAVREISATTADITVAARVPYPTAVAVSASGGLVVANPVQSEIVSETGGTVSVLAGDGTQGDSGLGGPAISASLGDPRGVAVDASGDVFIADAGNNAIYEAVAGTAQLRRHPARHHRGK